MNNYKKKHPYEKFGLGFEKEKEIKNPLIVKNIQTDYPNLQRLTTGRKLQSWYVDSGCSRHIMGEKSMFEDVRPKKEGWIIFGGKIGKIVGVGRIGKHPFPSIKNVFSVEGLKHNLLSTMHKPIVCQWI
ncbi:hypothetical protein CR513_48688, partial [Mucuna pruriens]